MPDLDATRPSESLFSNLERLNAQGGGNAEWPLIATALRSAQALRARIGLEDDADWGSAASLDDFDRAFAAVFGSETWAAQESAE